MKNGKNEPIMYQCHRHQITICIQKVGEREKRERKKKEKYVIHQQGEKLCQMFFLFRQKKKSKQ